MQKIPENICHINCQYIFGNSQCGYEENLKRTTSPGKPCLYSKYGEGKIVHKPNQSEQWRCKPSQLEI